MIIVQLRLTTVLWCECPVGGVLPPAGCFRLWGDALSLAGRVGYLWVEGWCVCVAGVAGLWSVDADGLVSVADDGVLRGVVQDAVSARAVSDALVDSCVELFFRVLRARGCV